MKTKILIISSLFIFTFFAVAAHAFADSTGKSADELISGSEVTTIQPGESANPQESRDKQKGQKGKDILDIPVGAKLTEALTPKEARNQEQSETDSAQNVEEAVETNSEQPEETTSEEPLSVKGGWYIELSGDASRTAALTLFQDGDTVYGIGNLNMDENTTLPTAATGFVAGNELDLDLISLEKVNLYKMTLTVNEDSATGDYTAYNPNKTPSTGTVSATKSV